MQNRPFYLELEGLSASISPQEALAELASIANNLKLSVKAEINGIKVFVHYPASESDIVRSQKELVAALNNSLPEECYIMV